MSSTRTVLIGLIAISLGMAALVFNRYDEANGGRLGFAVWKATSGQWRGDHHADVNGVRIYYETFGAGSPVLVMHGGLGRLDDMHYQIADLAGSHLVIAPDSRGHGRSSDFVGPLHYIDMSNDMLGLLDQLHIQRADLVGWSDGGIVALDLAMRHPERVGKLVVIGGNTDPSGLIALPAEATPEEAGPGASREAYAEASRDPDRSRQLRARVWKMWRTEPNYTAADLGRISAPVLVIAGEHDVIRRAHTDALTRAIPGAKELIVLGAGHAAPMQDPVAVDRAILLFLNPPRSRA
jgi:pimeloyl-ACP methyl ester carboxylesterase